MVVVVDFKEELKRFREDRRPMLEMPDDKPEVIRQKMETDIRIHSTGTKWHRYKTACDLWTSAFFAELTQQRDKDRRIPTTNDVYNYLDNRPLDARLTGYANALSNNQKFFHWQLEFPEVFDDGGFDVVLCNPPWERIKLQEQEFFSTRNAEVANAPNASARSRLITQLKQSDPNLWQEYQQALHDADSTSKFLRISDRFPLTGRGDINTYSIFTEHLRRLLSAEGRAGIVVPTGIATDDTNKLFFADTIESNALISLYDFENREKLFPDVDSRYKFSLLTMTGIGNSKRRPDMQFAFFLTQPSQLRDESRTFSLTSEDFNRLNPNTKTCPVFRTRADAELTRKIYERIPVLVNETTGENPWGISFLRMLDMSNDSHLFRTRDELNREGYALVGNCFVRGDETYLPLYEAKMIWQFDHRFGTYHGVQSRTDTHLPTPSDKDHVDSFFIIQPWNWVSKNEVFRRIEKKWKYNWFFTYRRVTTNTNERTMVVSVVPFSAVSYTLINVFPTLVELISQVAFMANMGSLVADFIIRQKTSQPSLPQFCVEQSAFLSPSKYTQFDLLFIVPRVLELVYTSWDIVSFADDVWKDSPEPLRSAINKQWDQSVAETGSIDCDTPDWAIIDHEGIPHNPAVWNEDRRARIRAELDAYYARLYGLTDEELRYILDPQDVYGKDFPGETFRVLKEKEIRQYGEYRTKRLVLEAWEKLNKDR